MIRRQRQMCIRDSCFASARCSGCSFIRSDREAVAISISWFLAVIPTRLFKQAVSLSKQARAIEAILDGMNPLNAGKKKEEALSMLKKWFPQMENFSGQLKKYKVTIKDLLEENQKLEARAKASESGKMKDRMERAKLESELENMQRLVNRIPPEVLAELKRQQRTRER